MLAADRRYVHERRIKSFVQDPAAPMGLQRTLIFEPPDVLAEESRRTDLAYGTSNELRRRNYVWRTFERDGSPSIYWVYDADFDESEQPTAIAFRSQPESFFQDTERGLSIVFREFSIDPVARTGRFEYVYEHFGATETGTLAGVERGEDGLYLLRLDDPLGRYDGQSTLRNQAGEIVFTKERRAVAGQVRRTYDLQEGLTAELIEESGAEWAGKLLEGGVEVADVQVRVEGNATTFTVTFPGAPDSPVVLGYGAPPAEVPPEPSPPAPAIVETVAGAPEAGYLDGVATAARFGGLYGIAQSTRNAALYYVTDFDNACVRTLTLAGDGQWQVDTLTGASGTPPLDGPLSQAGFLGPAGLVAVAAPNGGETLYVTDAVAGTVRAVTLDAGGAGAVTTLAGTGVPGQADGPGTAAQFQQPVGVVRDVDGGRLIVAERDGSRLRAVGLTEASHPVTTLLGTVPGFADGPASEARLDGPIGLAITPGRSFYVADLGNYRLRRVDLTAGALSLETVAGSGDPAKTYVDGPALAGGLGPGGLWIDARGRVVVTGVDVRVYDPVAGTLQTLAGGAVSGHLDGPAEVAGFTGSAALAQGPDGSLLVCDGFTIRQVRPGAAGAALLPR